MNYLAIDVGGTFVKYAVITGDCEIVEKGKEPTQKDTLESFLNSLTVIYERLSEHYIFEGIALSMPGLIDSKKGFMYTGGFVECISNLNMAQELENRCHIPVTVENDARCAAYAELWKGSLEGVSNGVVIVCGTGVGGAVIKDGEVLCGEHFLAGEFSFMLTNYDDNYKSSNCLAENTGVPALIRYVSETTGIDEDELDGEKIFAMANSGDARALAGFRRYVRHVAVQIHNCRCMFDPEKTVIGGGISVQPLFIQMIREELRTMNEIFPWKADVPKVDVCRFFNDSNLIGAVYAHIRFQTK